MLIQSNAQYTCVSFYRRENGARTIFNRNILLIMNMLAVYIPFFSFCVVSRLRCCVEIFIKRGVKDTKGGYLILNQSYGGINCRRVTSLDLLLTKSTPPPVK